MMEMITKLEKLEPNAYHKAMQEVSEKLNQIFGVNLHPRDDYKSLEIICKKMKLKFNEKGEIVNGKN